MTTCGNAESALSLLRERKGEFDIVLSDVYMPDMDGFKLMEIIKSELDIPVISKAQLFSLDGIVLCRFGRDICSATYDSIGIAFYLR